MVTIRERRYKSKYPTDAAVAVLVSNEHSAQQPDAQPDHEPQPSDYKMKQTIGIFITSTIRPWRQDSRTPTLRIRGFEPMTSVPPFSSQCTKCNKLIISVPNTQSVPVQVVPAHWLNHGDQTTFQINPLSSYHSHFFTNAPISQLPII